LVCKTKENTKNQQSDVQIQSEDLEFRALKFVFEAQNPFLAEVLQNNAAIEKLSSIDYSLYDELPGGIGINHLQLFAAAGKLKIEELKNFAAEKLIDKVDAENVLEIFKSACKYDHNELKQRAFEIIKKKYPGTKFKDELIDDAEKVEKLIAYLKKMEEIQRGIEDLL